MLKPLALLLALTAPVYAQVRVVSPDGRNRVSVEIQQGRLYYSVQRDGRPLLLPSLLGFEFRGAPPLRDSLRLVDTSRTTFDETWTQPWGEVRRVQDHHNELKVAVTETAPPARQFTVVFRVFNDGVGFRYEFPDQPNLKEFAITDELTEFAMADAARAPYADGTKVYGRTPFVTPWRTIQIADRATDLSPSLLGLKLNPPSVIPNTSWIKPMKYVGIWWGMHINTMTWSSGPKHGATTANTKRYIDFAAANGLGGVLAEGWNV